MKLELIVQPGHAVQALLATEFTPRQVETAVKLADRLFGANRVNYDSQLSYRWGCSVYCAAEFSEWWRGRDGAPAENVRIFLEVHAA